MTAFLLGLKRVLNCSKVQLATTALTAAWLAVRYATVDLGPNQRSALWIAFIAAVTVELREIINAWTEEDVARIQGGTQTDSPAVPATSNATASAKGKLTSAPVGGSTPAASSPASSVASPASPVHVISNSERNWTMPPRTKLPGLLLALGLLAMGTSACQQVQQALNTPAELVSYREGLHAVDEPLYRAHQLLVADAVKAGIRTPADEQVVTAGIAAAEALYQQSKATQATSVVPVGPTTQP